MVERGCRHTRLGGIRLMVRPQIQDHLSYQVSILLPGQSRTCAPECIGPAKVLADSQADMCSRSFFAYNTLLPNVLMIRNSF